MSAGDQPPNWAYVFRCNCTAENIMSARKFRATQQCVTCLAAIEVRPGDRAPLADRQRDRDRHRPSEADLRDRETETETDAETERRRQRDRETDRETETEGLRDRQTERRRQRCVLHVLLHVLFDEHVLGCHNSDECLSAAREGT